MATILEQLDEERVFLRGMPFYRRIELLHAATELSSTHKPPPHTVKVVQRWRQRAEEKSKGSFQRILDAYKLDERQLAHIVDLPQNKTFQWPIRNLIPEMKGEDDSFEWEYASSFAQVCDPLIKPFVIECHSIIHGLCIRYRHILGSNSERIIQMLTPALERKLNWLSCKTGILELNVARLREQLKGETPEGRFNDFMRLLQTESFQHQFLSEYAVIAYRAITIANHWLNNAKNLISRLCNDYDACVTQLLGGEKPGILESIAWDAGDSHRGGQAVCILAFSGNVKLVYKPHALAINLAFRKLLDHLNKSPLKPGLLSPKALDFDSHGWEEFITHEECREKGQIYRFYWRQGAFISIFHLLNTHDLHHENLIAHGEFPVYVDCETLTRPPEEMPNGKNYPSDLSPPLVSSLDLLPNKVWGPKAGEGVDISGLGGFPGQTLSDAVLKIDSPNTDQMRIIKGDLITEGAAHLPHYEGMPASASDHATALFKGFEAGYDTLLRLRGKFKECLSGFEGVSVRIVRRGTRFYADSLDISCHPDYQRDAVEREILLSTVLAHGKMVAPIQIGAELRDMSNDDIPYFSMNFTSCSIKDSDGLITGKLAASCDEVISKNAASLSKHRLKQQKKLIAAKLGIASAPALHESAVARIQFKHTAEPRKFSENNSGNNKAYNRDTFHHRMVRTLLENSIHSCGHRLWALPDLVDRENLETGPDESALIFDTNIGSLYNGLAGIGLYFMKLYAITNNSRYKHVFENILQSVLYWHEFVADFPMGCGLFDGRSGVGLFLIASGQQSNDNNLIEIGYRELLRANTDWDKETKWDVISGVAGHILALANAHDLLDDNKLVRAVNKAATELLKRSVEFDKVIAWENKDLSEDRPLAGFAHGAAGVGASLAIAGKLCSRELFIEEAWRAMAYEDTQYLPEERNWRDNRNFGKERNANTGPFLNAWCHGAAGIGLARSFLVPVVRSSREESILTRDIVRVKNSSYAPLRTDCLCHGILGNLACLQRIATATADQEWLNTLEELITQALRSIVKRGPRTGLGNDTHRRLYPNNAGLMCGLSGIGLAALNLAHSEESNLVLAGELINQSEHRTGKAQLRSDIQIARPVGVPDSTQSPVSTGQE